MPVLTVVSVPVPSMVPVPVPSIVPVPVPDNPYLAPKDHLEAYTQVLIPLLEQQLAALLHLTVCRKDQRGSCRKSQVCKVSPKQMSFSGSCENSCKLKRQRPTASVWLTLSTDYSW